MQVGERQTGSSPGSGTGHEGGPQPFENDGPAPFEAFAERERQPLTAFAWSLTGSYATAEEVVQEALTSAWRDWERVGAYDKPGAWARQVVARRCSDHRRSVGRETHALTRLAHRPTDPVDLPAPDEELWAAVRQLPDRQAQVIALYYLEDRSVAGIAEALDCAEGTVKAHLHKARAALARTLGLLDEKEEQR